MKSLVTYFDTFNKTIFDFLTTSRYQGHCHKFLLTLTSHSLQMLSPPICLCSFKFPLGEVHSVCPECVPPKQSGTTSAFDNNASDVISKPHDENKNIGWIRVKELGLAE